MKFLFLFCFTFYLEANTILHHAKVYTLNEKNPWVEALVIQEKEIIFVGSNKECLAYKTDSSKLIDLQGQFLMPGFIDAHTHTALASVLDTGISLVGTRGKKDILFRLKAYKKAHPHQRVYSGLGFYPYAFGPDGPTAKDLDDIFPDSYAFFLSNNAHQAWVNTRTLKYLGISKERKDPQKNIQYYYRDKEGNPTGFLIEGEAIWPHFAKMNIVSEDDFFNALANFLPQLSKVGITTLFDAGVLGAQIQAYKALNKLSLKKKLPLEYHLSFYLGNKKIALKSVRLIRKYQKLYENENFHISSLKFINDNSDDDNFGLIFQEKDLVIYLSKILEADVNVMIHTSQDKATHLALNALEKVKYLYPKSQSRVSLAHVNMVRESDFKRFKDLDIIANIQSFNAVGGGYYEYRYMLYDEKWDGKLARYRHFFDEGVRVSASSDYPVCGSVQKCSPLNGIQIALTRQKIGKGKDAEVLSSIKERTTLTQILKAYTLDAAYQLGAEKRIGSLERAKDADFIILDKNPFDTDVYGIHKIKVKQTWSKGRRVYKEKNE